MRVVDREPSVDPGDVRPRFLSRSLTRGQRRVYLGVTAWFLLVAFGTTWPGYLLFNRVRPLVLGLPLSLFWVALLAVLSFCVGLGLLVWESRSGLIDDASDPEA